MFYLNAFSYYRFGNDAQAQAAGKRRLLPIMGVGF